MNVLVLSPHPDDEAIGCGGTILRHVEAGDAVHVVFLTSGENGGHGRPPGETRVVREAEARDAARILRLRGLEFWGLPDGQLRVTPALRARLRACLRRLRPRRVYVPHGRESHPDHRASLRLLRQALAPAPPSSLDVLMYELWTPLQRMDVINDISSVMELKLAAVRAYACQCAVLAFDDAIQGLNRYRGEMHCWPGGDYAEVFARLRP